MLDSLTINIDVPATAPPATEALQIDSLLESLFVIGLFALLPDF